MSPQPTGKQKSLLVPLSYPNVKPRRVMLALVIGGLALLTVGAVMVLARWENWASPGPVHAAHAAWEDNCAACHVPFSPTSSQNGLLKPGTAADALCVGCHKGPPHHKGRERPENAASCASCHVDHKGRHALISAVPDRTCTNCHGDLAKHTQGGAPLYAGKVTSFHRDHPQFRLGAGEGRKELGEAKDPGKLRFNHKLHLTAGLKGSDKDSRDWLLEDIKDEALRQRYEAQQDNKEAKAAVVLTCASCHQLDPADAPPPGPGQSKPYRAPGGYFQPVTYDQHCKACHPLTFDDRLPRVEVPHHLQPGAVSEFLWGAFAEAKFPPRGGKEKGDRPLPGWNLPRDELLKRKAEVGAEVGLAEDQLWLKDTARARSYVLQGRAACGLCHEYEVDARTKKPSIAPTNVPVVWYEHAKFSHQAHRAVDCLQCHGQSADGPAVGANESTVSSDVLLPGVANCVKCHAPAKGSGAARTGGVRSDCVTCHNYHHGDAPLAGRGAAARVPAKPGDIGALLRGLK